MTYTENDYFSLTRPTKQDFIQEEVPVQEIFHGLTVKMKTNDAASMNLLRIWLGAFPQLSSIKDSTQKGFPLLFYAVELNNTEAAKIIVSSFESLKNIDLKEDSGGQTALHFAVTSNREEMVDLLLEHGADVNIQDARQQSALWKAAAAGNLSITRKITAVKGVNLETKDNYGLSPLHVAAEQDRLQVAEHLIDSGADVDLVGPENNTPLHAAAKKSTRVAKLLISRGANPNLKDAFQQTPLFLATTMQSVELVKLMVERNGDPYIEREEADTVFHAALTKRNIQLLKALWNKESTKTLYQAAIEGNLHKVRSTLSENQFTKTELEVMFLSCVNHHMFETASLLLNHESGLLSKYQTSRPTEEDLEVDPNRESFREKIINKYKERFSDKLVFKGTSFEDKSESILRAFAQISELLCDVPECIALLKPLDEELKGYFPQLSDITPRPFLKANNLLWPGAPEEDYQPLDKKGMLRKILRTFLQEYGIETQDELYTFAGFVDPDTANELVKKGALFKEQILLGNANMHGLYTHYLQWYLIAQAIESKRIEFQDGLTLKEVLQASVEVREKVGTPAWATMIDHVAKPTYTMNGDTGSRSSQEGQFPRKTKVLALDYRFSAVNYFSSFLYTSEKIPSLRGYLTDNLYKYTEKITKVMARKFPEDQRIEHEHIIAGQAIASWAFSRFNLGLTLRDVVEYYEKRAKTGGTVDENTGIVTKPCT